MEEIEQTGYSAYNGNDEFLITGLGVTGDTSVTIDFINCVELDTCDLTLTADTSCSSVCTATVRVVSSYMQNATWGLSVVTNGINDYLSHNTAWWSGTSTVAEDYMQIDCNADSLTLWVDSLPSIDTLQVFIKLLK